MKKLVAFALILVAASVFAACRSNAPTSTPVPPTAVVPTSLPPAPTAPALTEAPTAVVPTQAPQPTAIQVEPTTAPANPTASNSPSEQPANPTSGASNNPPAVVVTNGPLAGLYLVGLRYDPTYPRNKEPLNFYATLINRTTKDQNYPVCVELYRVGEPKAFGITNCDVVTIPPGTNEVAIGTWTGTGIKECLPVQARTVLKDQDQDNVYLPLTTTGGASPWTNFQVCP